MRTLLWGQYPLQQTDFLVSDCQGKSIIVDGSPQNGVSQVLYDPALLDPAVFGYPGTSDAYNRDFFKILLSRIRAQIGHTPVLVRARLYLRELWNAPGTLGYTWTTGLFRLLTTPNWASVDHRYRDIGATTPWGGDAAIYAPVPGVDHNPAPFATKQWTGLAANPGEYWFFFDVSSELAFRLQSNSDLVFMAAAYPIGGVHAGTPQQQDGSYWKTAGKYPYLEIKYRLPIEFYACNADVSIDFMMPLDNSLDLDLGNLYLGAIERGQTSTPVSVRVKNLGSRLLAHLEVWDDWPEWQAPVANAGNAGNAALAYVTLAEFSVSQEYTVKFTSPTAYQVLAMAYKDNPTNLNSTYGTGGWTGAVGTDFVAPAGGLTIPAAAWSGTAVANDTIVIDVVGNTTDASWPYDSNTQVQIAKDNAGTPDNNTWRPIKAQRTSLAAGVTIDATSKTITVLHIDTSKWPNGTKVFIANTTTIDEGTVTGSTATSLTITFTISNNVYVIGAKVGSTLPIRGLGTSVIALTTGAAGASQTNPAYIPLVNASTLGFSAGQTIVIESSDDSTIKEIAVVSAADNTRILCTAYLTKDYTVGASVLQGASGEAVFWLRAVALMTTAEELKRVRLNART
jgi:hypothetical protein